jgi:hypothetical protein
MLQKMRKLLYENPEEPGRTLDGFQPPLVRSQNHRRHRSAALADGFRCDLEPPPSRACVRDAPSVRRSDVLLSYAATWFSAWPAHPKPARVPTTRSTRHIPCWQTQDTLAKRTSRPVSKPRSHRSSRSNATSTTQRGVIVSRNRRPWLMTLHPLMR